MTSVATDTKSGMAHVSIFIAKFLTLGWTVTTSTWLSSG